MLILSLELVKNRMGAMHGDLRRIFLNLFTALIEKSPVSYNFFQNAFHLLHYHHHLLHKKWTLAF